MEHIGSVIGIVTGLAAIFTFVTGYRSLAEFRAAQERRPPEVRVRFPRLIYVYGAVFAVLIAVTLAMGLSGDDIGGFMAFMLSLAAAAVIGYEVWLRQRWSPHRFGLVAAVGLVAISLVTAPITRGEEGFAIAVGVVIACGAWAIIVFQHRLETRRTETGVPPRTAPPSLAPQTEPSIERTILEIAAAKNGTVRATDIALGSELSLDQAAEALDSLCARNHCRKTVRDNGATVYEFPDLVDA